MRYLIVIEEGESNLSAFAPDVPGCVVTGDTREEVKQEMTAALELHLEGLRQDGTELPTPASVATYVDVTTAA